MTEPQDSVTDPWAWLHEADAPHELVAMHSVAALIVEGADLEASRRTEETLDSLEPGVKLVGYVEADDLADASLEIATDLETEFVWFLPAGCLPAPDCLERLLRCATAESGAQVVSPLLLQPRRRGHGPLIQEFGQTLTGSGRVVSLAEEGDPYQGQLSTTPVLGCSWSVGSSSSSAASPTTSRRGSPAWTWGGAPTSPVSGSSPNRRPS